MPNIPQPCQRCQKTFLVIDQEQEFLRKKELPSPVWCPACRQLRRLSLRGGRQLFRTKCQQCQKDIVVSYDPTTVKNPILCREDYDKYFNEHDPIITEPLP